MAKITQLTSYSTQSEIHVSSQPIWIYKPRTPTPNGVIILDKAFPVSQEKLFDFICQAYLMCKSLRWSGFSYLNNTCMQM